MKTANWGKTILAVLLALTMVLPAVAGMAEGEATKVGDVEWLYAYTDESGIFLDYKDESGSYGSEEVPSGTITAKAVNSEEDGVTIYNNGGTVELAVDEVQAKEDGLCISSVASGEGNKTPETTVTVAKDVHTVAENPQPVGEEEGAMVSGIDVNASGGKIAVEVAGEVSAEATVTDGKVVVHGVSANGSADSTTEITVGSVSVALTSESKEYVDAAAVYGFASGEGAQITNTVSGDISATVKITGEESFGSAMGVSLEVKDGGTATLNATDSDITATAEGKDSSAVAMGMTNGGGDIAVDVVGDVIASGGGDTVGVVVESTPSEMKNSIDTEAEPVEINLDDVEGFLPVLQENTYAKGNTDLTITGDVKGDIGVEMDVNEVQTANITVDGTIEGETAGIVLSADTKLSDDITMTVWEVKPNKDGAVVAREEWNKEKDEWVYTEDKEAEKLIQYIIKVEDASKDYIATSGTKAFTAGNGNEYQVAHEGDKVLLKLNIPEGKELVDAFWDVAKSQAGRLLKDAEGNYYLEVPRGGGVLLSVTLKDVPKQESKGTAQTAEAKPYPYVLAPILKVRDQTGMVEIDFYRNKRFIVKLEHGGQEEGTFRTEDGILILKCADETEFSFDMGEGEVVYITRDSTGKHYTFKLEPKELDILLKLK